MKTRADYMAKKCSHREYYGQFVTEAIKGMVLSAFTLEELLNSNDEHLNDLPLSRWDQLAGGMGSTLKDRALREAGDFSSLGSSVCILKEAARQIIEANTHMPHQPKTGAACSCRPGSQRDNCQRCEGTGMVIDFAKIRAA